MKQNLLNINLCRISCITKSFLDYKYHNSVQAILHNKQKSVIKMEGCSIEPKDRNATRPQAGTGKIISSTENHHRPRCTLFWSLVTARTSVLFLFLGRLTFCVHVIGARGCSELPTHLCKRSAGANVVFQSISLSSNRRENLIHWVWIRYPPFVQ